MAVLTSVVVEGAKCLLLPDRQWYSVLPGSLKVVADEVEFTTSTVPPGHQPEARIVILKEDILAVKLS